MSFCRLESDYIKQGYTQVDNVFLTKYLPAADAVDVKVYLYGLTLASLPDDEKNTLERLALALKLTEQRVIDAFKYWEEKGLVSITAVYPLCVNYFSPKSALPSIVKYKAKEYASFVEESVRLFPDRILTPNELTEFIELIRIYKIEANALLMIMKYCIDYKEGAASAPYILAVANDWIRQGLITVEQVNEHITRLEANSEAIRMILKAVGAKRDAELDDRQLYIKWTKQYGYSLDAVLTAAKAQKRRGGMTRLDRYIDELKNANAFTVEEIAAYAENRQKVYDLAINIMKNIGGYYASMDIVIETYVQPWLSKGFSHDGLLSIARHCFVKGVKTLDGMDQLVDKFFNLGLLEERAIDGYIEGQAAVDRIIKDIFQACSHSGLITNREREYYRIWREWGFDDDVILAVAALADKNPFPIQNINRNLAALYQNNIYDVASVMEYLEDTQQRSAVRPAEEQGIDLNKAIDIINSRRSLAELKAHKLLSSLREDPRFSETENKMDEISFEIAKREALKRDLGSLKDQLHAVKAVYDGLLEAKGMQPSDLEIQYSCPVCGDTGFVKGQKCGCLKAILGE